MTFNLTQVINPTGVKGRMLLSAKETATSGTYPFATEHLFSNLANFPNKSVKPIRAENWTLKGVTSNFDAVENDGSALLNLGSVDSDFITLQNNTKVIVVAHIKSSGHSATENVTLRLATNSASGIGYANGMDSSNLNTSSLTASYSPTWNSYQNSYSKPIPTELNDIATGPYFKRAKVRKLQDDLIYGFFHVPTTGTFNLCFEITALTSTVPAATSYNQTVPNAHFIKLIQLV